MEVAILVSILIGNFAFALLFGIIGYIAIEIWKTVDRIEDTLNEREEEE